MDKPTVVRKGDAELLFDAGQVAALAESELKFRDVAVNNSSLVPGGRLPLGVHDDKLEVVTPVALGPTEGPIVRYTDDAGGYDLELTSYDSIVIPRGVTHTAYNLCDCDVALIITNFDYPD
jgi:hypothetical protein